MHRCKVVCAPYLSSNLLRSRYVPGTRTRSAYQAIEDLKLYCLMCWPVSETKQLLRTKGLTVFNFAQKIDIYFWTLASSEKLWNFFSWKQLQAGSALSSLCKNIPYARQTLFFKVRDFCVTCRDMGGSGAPKIALATSCYLSCHKLDIGALFANFRRSLFSRD